MDDPFGLGFSDQAPASMTSAPAAMADSNPFATSAAEEKVADEGQQRALEDQFEMLMNDSAPAADVTSANGVDDEVSSTISIHSSLSKKIHCHHSVQFLDFHSLVKCINTF